LSSRCPDPFLQGGADVQTNLWKTFRRKLFAIVLTAAVLFVGVARGQEAPDAESRPQRPVKDQEWTVPGLDMKMVYVGRGSFRMGSRDGAKDEKPVHRVSISRHYWIGKYEVVQSQFRTFSRATRYRTEADRRGGAWVKKSDGWVTPNVGWTEVFPGENQPVTCVSWNDIIVFCEWLTEREQSAGRLSEGYQYRLPTEAEWEYAARGGGKSEDYPHRWLNYKQDLSWYYQTGSKDLKEAAWYYETSGGQTHPVGQKAPNELGIHDMLGNVTEWCLDSHESDYYARSPETDPVNTAKPTLRVSRGGAWLSCAADCRPARRFRNRPYHRGHHLGFRVVLGPAVSAGPRLEEIDR
jgi:formylglycine-generating enzyme required for sulfatase activity